jgi:hypothetical protein
MNRVFRLVMAFCVLGFLGACEKTTNLSVDRVEPAEGITAGGDRVTIRGAGFVPGKTQLQVRFGRHVAEQIIISSNEKISVVTPNGDKGPVDVTLDFDNGQRFKIPNGFRYVDPQKTGDTRKAFFGKQEKK